ncbi:hypothetical protein LE181_06530 [Streptomyces sp. SCA3-4]|uniref:hypothetical protein n=1 Tax=Streptomyces sichuanensis TaxID=2871810 RepID=UPI001CE3602A|nr:hypothetical protein [Streptomyces sichuanensis]MCA6091822.1 hypothetical protein [Streptomyces sichuanensis]
MEGLPVTDFWADTGEPRSIVIILQPEAVDAAPEDDDEEPRELRIIWAGAGAWQFAWMRPDGSNESPDQLPGYPGSLALPEDAAESYAPCCAVIRSCSWGPRVAAAGRLQP